MQVFDSCVKEPIKVCLSCRQTCMHVETAAGQLSGSRAELQESPVFFMGKIRID